MAGIAIIGRNYNGVPPDKIILDARAAQDAAKAQLEIKKFNDKVAQKVSSVDCIAA